VSARRVRSALAGWSLAACALLLASRPAAADIVTGHVHDEQGNPVFNADFNVYDAATGDKLLPSDKTDAAGKYRLLVDAGRYDILCRPVIGGPLAPRIVHGVPVNGTLTLDFVLPPAAQVRGRVTYINPADSSVVGVFPCDLDFDRTDDGTRQPAQGDVTSPFGTFITYIETASYTVTANPIDTTLAPGRVYDWVLPTTDILQLPLQPASHLAGTIRDEHGAPVAGVQLRFDDGTGVRQPASKHASDANGFYRLGIAPGIYRITVEPPLKSSFPSFRVPDVDLTTSQLQSYTLVPGAGITGVVSDKAGRPIAKANWDVWLESGEAAATPGDNTGLDGQYRMVLAPGLYKMRLTPPASTGLDSVVMHNVAISRDTTIDVDYAILTGGTGGSSPVVRFAPRGNPTHTTAAISLVLNKPVSSALVEVYDVAGSRAGVLHTGPLGVGTHNLHWDGRRASGEQAHTGVYFVRARLDAHEQVTRFVLLP
jgi:hypothetical protein